jgi:hypothetical protein
LYTRYQLEGCSGMINERFATCYRNGTGVLPHRINFVITRAISRR